LPGLIRPPYGEPTGPYLAETALFAEFLEGARTGHSLSHHIEESALLMDRMAPVALRLSHGAVLVRTDLSSPALVTALPGLGYSMVSQDPPLSTVVGLQVLGMPAAMWDLWAGAGSDAQEALERTAGAGPPGAGW
jgi:hypothetical protein